MPRNLVVIGPPGTGKTRSMVTIASGWFKGGASPDQVAFLAFTRAAANEAGGRILDEKLDLQLPQDGKLPFFRTLHSLAFRGMARERRDKRLIGPGDMKGFANWSGFEGKFTVAEWEDLSDAYAHLENGGRTHWDTCMNAYSLSRISCRTAEQLEIAKTRMSKIAARNIGWIEEDVYRAFVLKYELYKKANGLIDFTDMLAFALTEMEPIRNVKYVIIDEAQDLAPCLHAITSRIFQDSEEIWWTGDANQAIFGFAAADARLFIERINTADHVVTLRDTHRFGQEVVDFSTKIIQRARDKYVVDVQGMPGRKHVISRSGSFKPGVEPMLILHRHVMGCQALAAAYIDAGMPFINERGRSPLDSDNRTGAFRTIRELSSGKASSPGSIMRLVDEFMPSLLVDPKSGKKVRLVVLGAKTELQEGKLTGEMTLADLIYAKILTAEGAEAIRAQQFRVFDHPEDLEYYKRVVENGYSLQVTNQEGKITVPVITTIHGSKGRQAPKVVIFQEMGKKCKEDMDNEHRLAYVAATRTEGGIEICAERTVDWAEESYDYPMPKKPEEIDFDA